MSIKDLESSIWSYPKKSKYQKWEEMVSKLEDVIEDTKIGYQKIGKNVIAKNQQFQKEAIDKLVYHLNVTQTNEIVLPRAEIFRILKAKYDALIEMTPCLQCYDFSTANIRFFHPRYNKIFRHLEDSNGYTIPLKLSYDFDLQILDNIYKRDKQNLNYSTEYLTLLGYIYSKQDNYNKPVSLDKMRNPKDISVQITRNGMKNMQKQALAIELRQDSFIQQNLAKPTNKILERKQVIQNKNFIQKEKLKGNQDKRLNILFNMLLISTNLGMINSLATRKTVNSYWNNFVLHDAQFLMRGLIIGNLYSLINDIEKVQQQVEFKGIQQEIFDQIMNIFEGIFVVGCQQQKYLTAIAQTVTYLIQPIKKQNLQYDAKFHKPLIKQIIATFWGRQ